MSIAAITVTFNRTETLKKNIEALLKQNTRIDYIVIADNGSNDEHAKIIREIESLDDRIHVLWLGENLGGGGGFENGMRYAKEQFNPDWYWIMDDDAYPRRDTLEKLLSHVDLPDIGALMPVIYGVDWQKYQLYHAKSMTAFLTKDRPKYENYESIGGIEEIDADAFVGPLFPRKIVDELGYADGGMFIYGDDTEYTTRVHQKYKLYLIKESVIDHNDPPVSNDVFSPKTYWKLYYTLRNRIIIAMKYNKGLRKIPVFILSTKDMLWQVVYTMVRTKLQKRGLRLKIVLKAYRDGMFGRRGKTIDPSEFAKKV